MFLFCNDQVPWKDDFKTYIYIRISNVFWYEMTNLLAALIAQLCICACMRFGLSWQNTASSTRLEIKESYN